MLLTIISENTNTVKEFATNDNTERFLWAVHSTSDSLIIKNEVLRTAYFYRILTPPVAVPPCNVAHSTGMDLHRFMWMVHTTLSGVNGVIIMKPSVILGALFRSKIIEKLSDPKLMEGNWGILKGDHDKYFVLNPIYSHVYKSNNIDEIVRCCEANDVEVITDDELVYDPVNMDLNYKQWSYEDFGGFRESNINIKQHRPLNFNDKISLTDYQTKNIVYLKFYEDDLKPLLDKFENSASFSTIDEFKDRLDEFPSNTTWIIGNFFVGMMIYFMLPFNELLSIISRVLSLPDSIVWAKLYHTPEEVHSTLKIHNLYKGPIV